MRPERATPPSVQHAWVAFSGKTDIRWLHFLKPGFRHCFVIWHDGAQWVTLDATGAHLDVIAHHALGPHMNMPAWLRREAGCRVVPAPIDRTRKTPAPLAPFTCVEAVKRALGLHDRWIVTPWQLYRRLTFGRKKNGKS
jgi:hypothetical protein